jgi:hypothetical protein
MYRGISDSGSSAAWRGGINISQWAEYYRGWKRRRRAMRYMGIEMGVLSRNRNALTALYSLAGEVKRNIASVAFQRGWQSGVIGLSIFVGKFLWLNAASKRMLKFPINFLLCEEMNQSRNEI